MRVARFTAITALLGSACAALTAALVSLGVHGAAASTPTAIAIVGPAGSGTFGDDVLVLSNDNFIVTESMFSRPTAANVGAAYLYSGPDQHLVSTLTGSLVGAHSGDHVGTDHNGQQFVAALVNGNYVIGSSHWRSGAGAGGATNSLDGTRDEDHVGADIVALRMGNDVVGSPEWSTPTVTNVGAVTWGNADVLGFFSATTSFGALVPARLLDSRAGFATIDGASAGAGVRPTGTITTVHVAGGGGVPLQPPLSST